MWGLEQDADVQLRRKFGSNWFLLKSRHVEGPLVSVVNCAKVLKLFQGGVEEASPFAVK